jgi:hypothetical protein
MDTCVNSGLSNPISTKSVHILARWTQRIQPLMQALGFKYEQFRSPP